MRHWTQAMGSEPEGLTLKGADDSVVPEELRVWILQFEEQFRGALEETYGEMPSEFRDYVLPHLPVAQWNLPAFAESYVAGGWPPERLGKVMAMLMDIKLELYYLIEVDLGLYNRLYHGPINADPGRAESPRLRLVRQSIDQSVIGKVRILWERIMRFIYYFEFGREPEGKSVQRRFFRDIPESNPRWGWMAPYRAMIERYDEDFRTPEFHQGSKLRTELHGSPRLDANDLMAPLNHAVNTIWHNAMENVKHGTSFVFGGLHEPWEKWSQWVDQVRSGEPADGTREADH
ncbi:MAG: hypothetical protein HYX57_11910 [Chloroflexi bacterium]|nr:hypothetical protein [Chloroflexota bacterium]